MLMLYREEVGHTTSYQDAIAALDFVIERGTASSNATAIGQEVIPTALGDQVLRGHQDAELIRTLKPLSIRAVNYYPRATPWGGLWTKTPPGAWEQDMALAASLRINTVRTFLMFSSAMEQAGLVREDGAPTPAYLEKIETFLAGAWKHRIRAILCFEFSQEWLAAPGAEAGCTEVKTTEPSLEKDDG